MKIGIVGNGGIVQYALSILQTVGAETPALWCRNKEKGTPLCEQYGCTLYTDYDAFLQDSSYDTVYIGLINSLHYEYAVKAVEAGKNCIIEKPFTTTYKEAADLQERAEKKGVMLFEAIMSRYSRNYESIREHLKLVGDVKLVTGTFCKYSSRYDDYLQGKVLPAFDPALSGGALYDINVYNIHFAEGLFGMPQSVRYAANKGFNGIDTSGAVVMDYGTFKAVCTGAKDCDGGSGTVIRGTKGTITVPERPGVVCHVTFTSKDGKERDLDVQDERNPMGQELDRIREIVDQNDRKQAEAWMQDTLQVMKILEEARKDAGIVFPADRN